MSALRTDAMDRAQVQVPVVHTVEIHGRLDVILSDARTMLQSLPRKFAPDSDSVRIQEIPMNITRAGSRPSAQGPADWFTGTVRIDPMTDAQSPAHVGTGLVTFEPGARTNWHTHPLGQTIYITVGLGWVQREGGMTEEVRPGDAVFFAPGERHWHGAAPQNAMTHLAITETQDGVAVTWLEPVSDEQYRQGEAGCAD